MTRYLIKGTYTEGIHAGKSFLLQKGGYVTDENSYQWEETTYASERIARYRCKKLFEDNEVNRKLERERRAQKEKQGLENWDFFIYESQTYEPYPVDV